MVWRSGEFKVLPFVAVVLLEHGDASAVTFCVVR